MNEPRLDRRAWFALNCITWSLYGIARASGARKRAQRKTKLSACVTNLTHRRAIR